MCAGKVGEFITPENVVEIIEKIQKLIPNVCKLVENNNITIALIDEFVRESTGICVHEIVNHRKCNDIRFGCFDQESTNPEDIYTICLFRSNNKVVSITYEFCHFLIMLMEKNEKLFGIFKKLVSLISDMDKAVEDGAQYELLCLAMCGSILTDDIFSEYEFENQFLDTVGDDVAKFFKTSMIQLLSAM